MNSQTFKANLALLDRRWPWPEESAESKQDYRARLWARVEGWKGEYVTHFRQVVENLVGATRYAGRPSVDEITSAVYLRMGGKTAIEVDATTVRRERIEGDLRAFLESRWIRHDSSFEWIRGYISGITRDEVTRLWPRFLRWSDCPECGFGLALLNGRTKHRLHLDCLGCKHLYSVPDGHLRGLDYDGPEQTTAEEQEREDKLRSSPWRLRLPGLLNPPDGRRYRKGEPQPALDLPDDDEELDEIPF